MRPPAIPLSVRCPYLSTWLAGDSLVGQWATFWNGNITAICGLARIDGVTYELIGDPREPALPPMRQTAAEVTTTRSRFTLTGAGTNISVVFFSPVDPENLQRQSIPFSYMVIQAESADGLPHQVSIYVDISGEWAYGDSSESISWASEQVGSMIAHSCSPTYPNVLAEKNEQARWGSVILAADAGAGLTWQIAQDTVARSAAAESGRLANTVDGAQPRAINDRWPVFAFNQELGSVSGLSPEFVLCIGHVRDPAIKYHGTPLHPWWGSYWGTWGEMLAAFRADFRAASQDADILDARINAAALASAAAAGPEFSALCALALRQAYAGTELVAYQGQPWAFLKEISSGGFVSTVDVVYPSFPAYLYLSPTYLKFLLEPLLVYAESGAWPKAYAEHDLGHYPNADGHDDGNEEDMPVEESANMLIMSAAVVQRLLPNDAAAFATAHYPRLRAWADYLELPPDGGIVPNALDPGSLDPGSQPTTDDFTETIGHNVNLALKGIIGLGAMSVIARTAENFNDQAHYLAVARNFISQWAIEGADGIGTPLRLAYDKSGSWSLKYNGYPDKLLGLDLVPESTKSIEAALYLDQANEYGVPLDSRASYTKADWELWAAAFLADYPPLRDMFIEKVFAFISSTPDRVPFSDWYETKNAQWDKYPGAPVGLSARPVVGGVFSLLTLRKIAGNSRDFLQSDWGKQGNFELLVPSGNAIKQYFRNNDDPNLPWRHLRDFGYPVSPNESGSTPLSVSFIQSNFKGDGVHGNFEAVVRLKSPTANQPDYLNFWYLDSKTSKWNGPYPLLADGELITGVTGDPVLLQSDWGKQGNFELLVPSGNAIKQYFRNNDDPNLPWRHLRDFGYPVPSSELGPTPLSVAFIQSNFKGDGVHGNFEAIVRVKAPTATRPDYSDFWYLDSKTSQWNGPFPLIADGQQIIG